MIDVTNLSIALKGRAVLKDVSLSFQASEFVGIVGPNGAGKSTFLRGLAGVQAVAGGGLAVGGSPLADLSHAQRARAVTWLSQVRDVSWNLLAEDLVALGRFVLSPAPYARLGEVDRLAVDDAMARAGASAFKGRHTLELSGGEQARLHLARTLCSPARVLLLDEPCAALDIAHQLEMMSVFAAEANQGRLLIAALHDLSLAARYCSRIIVMDAGTVVADGLPANALSDEVLKDVFRVKRASNGTLERIL